MPSQHTNIFMGSYAGRAHEQLRQRGIDIAGRVVDDEYIGESGAIPRKKLLESGKPYVIIRGYEQAAYYLTKEEVLRHWPGCVEEILLATLYDYCDDILPDALPKEFYEQNKSSFDRVRQNLADLKSKQTLDAWLTTKLTDEPAPHTLLEPNQYFGFKAPWSYTESEVFFDCGAYTGDSIAMFISACKGKYKQIIACEPDLYNYKMLSDYAQREALEHIVTYPLGVYDKKETLRFSSGKAGASKVSGDGETIIEVDSIDNILNGAPVTIIKMDVEGSERFALKGAENSIKKYRPILMICVYHLKDDVFTIYEEISGFVTGYRYYLRWHTPTTNELVLYAVPEERITE